MIDLWPMFVQRYYIDANFFSVCISRIKNLVMICDFIFRVTSL